VVLVLFNGNIKTQPVVLRDKEMGNETIGAIKQILLNEDDGVI
jgi:hypothetical protein